VRVTIYDARPGAGLGQWFLKTSWLLGCWLQKRLGLVDAYVGVVSWDEAATWLARLEGVTSFQYWGHGAPGWVFLAEKTMPRGWLVSVKGAFAPGAIVWFRCCEVAQGRAGHEFMRALVKDAGCTVAAHTFVVGPWQSGLHTMAPGAEPTWPLDEGTGFRDAWWPHYLSPWLPRTVFCLRTRVPEGW
jgi:hypothetical protein